MLERGVDEAGGAGALSTCLQVLSGVQQRFFEQGDWVVELGEAEAVWAGSRWHPEGALMNPTPPPLLVPACPPPAADPSAADVRPLLCAARQAVLAGMTVLFSRVMPLDCADPTAHPLWQLAVKVQSRGGGSL